MTRQPIADAGMIIALLGLGILSYGWAFYPPLAWPMAVANLIYLSALALAWLVGRSRRFFLRGREMPVPAPGRTDIVTNSEVDYFGLAKLLIGQHGPDARTEAVRLMQEAQHEDDPEALADWRAVAQAITLLTSDPAAARN